jgi:hypothetical protein
MRRKSRGNAAHLSNRQTGCCQQAHNADGVEAARATKPRGRLRRTAASQPPTGGKLHDQIGESLRKLWRKARSCQPPPSRPALLPQNLQGDLPGENSEGPCVHATVVWLRTSQGFAGDGRTGISGRGHPSLALLIRVAWSRPAGSLAPERCGGLCRSDLCLYFPKLATASAGHSANEHQESSLIAYDGDMSLAGRGVLQPKHAAGPQSSRFPVGRGDGKDALQNDAELSCRSGMV